MTRVGDDEVLDQIDHMQRSLVDHGQGDLGMWRELCERHVRLIRDHGFENFKRTINFEYHQWAISSFRDPRSITLARRLLARGRIPWTLLRSRAGARIGDHVVMDSGVPTARAMRAYRLHVGLLWDFALLEDDLGCMSTLEEPLVGHPIEIESRGTLISQDLALSSLELNAIARVCDLSKVERVAEIGAGYGRFAWMVMSLYPRLSYTIIDIPPALAVSQNYLAATLGPQRVRMFGDAGAAAEPGTASFMLPYQSGALPEGLDLVVNVSSFDEMPDAEVERYFELIDQKLDGWLYLKGYKVNTRTGRHYDSFPYRPSWQRVWARTDPTNDRFVEQIYRVSADHP